MVVGAGQLGQKTVSGLRSLHLEPALMCDNNPALWGETVAGLPVSSPSDASRLYRDTHLFIVSIWNPNKSGIKPLLEQFETLGCRYIQPFAQLFLEYPETFLPHGLFENPAIVLHDQERIAAASSLFKGYERQEFEAQLSLRLRGDFSNLSDPVPGIQYFPPDLIQLHEDEYFVECGAYNGDTLGDFLVASRGTFKRYIAYEPDPINFATLEAGIDDPRIEAKQVAIARQRGTLQFHATGTDSSAVRSDASLSVDCMPLDELLANKNPTYIKMDIEGFEPEALIGAREVIKRCKPKLAVCVYHHCNHLWELPLLMKELQPDADLYLRPHLADGWDLVCYSIPR